AASLGINGAAWKVFAFGVGAMVAGAAGCFYASFVGTLVPDAFYVSEAFTILAMVIVGGMGTLIGPVFGAILLTLLPEILRGIGDLRLVVYGAALTFVVLFMPGGLVQAARIVQEKLRSGGRTPRRPPRQTEHFREGGGDRLCGYKNIIKAFAGAGRVRVFYFMFPTHPTFAM